MPENVGMSFKTLLYVYNYILYLQYWWILISKVKGIKITIICIFIVLYKLYSISVLKCNKQKQVLSRILFKKT